MLKSKLLLLSIRWIVALLVVCGYYLFCSPDVSNVAWDSFHYKEMAVNPFRSTTPPFGYRLLSPSIVYLLPFSIETGFVLLTSLCLICASVVTSHVAMRCGLNYVTSLAAIPLFLFHGGALWLLHAPCHVDAFIALTVSVAILSFLNGYPGIAAPAIVLGVLNKESSLFLLPCYWFSGRSKENWNEWVERLLVTLAALAVFAIVRYVWFSYTTSGIALDKAKNSYEFFQFYVNEIQRLWSTKGGVRLLSFSTYTFGMGTLLGFAVLGLRAMNRELRPFLLLLPPVIIQLFFVTGDLRLKLMALPLLVPLALLGIADWVKRPIARALFIPAICSIYIWNPDNILLGIVLTAIVVTVRKVFDD